MKRTFLAGILALMILLLALPGVVSAADLKVEGSILPPAPVAVFSATPVIGGPAPLSVSFTDASTPVGNIDTWKWEYRITGSTTWTEFSTEQSPSFDFNAGYYDIRLTVSNAAGSDDETKTKFIAVSAGPKRLTTVQSGTVSGDLYVGAFQTIPWASQTSYVTNTFDQPFTLPAYTNIQWARLYTVVYGSNTDAREGTVTVKFDGNGDGSYETTLGTETLSTVSDSTANVYPVNDHVDKQYLNYQIQYDVTSLISSQNLKAQVVCTPVASNFDARINEVTLIVAYNDGDTDVVKYWVNDGFDFQPSSASAVTINFDTDALSSGWSSATLVNVHLSSKDATYLFNSNSLTGSGTSNPSFATNVWDVTSALIAGSDSSLTYTHAASSSFKTTLAALKVKFTAPTADFTATPTSVDRGQEVTFTDASTGATGWEWDFDNNGVVDSTAQNPTYTYTTVGMKTVKLTVTGPTGTATETKADYITVKEPAPIIDFTPTSASGPRPLTVNFAGTNNGGAVNSWKWEYSTNHVDWMQFATIQDPAPYEFAAAGTYDIRLTATGPDYTDIETKTSIIQVGDSSIAVTVTDASIPFGTMAAGETKTGSRTVNVDVTGGTAWYVTAADNDAVTKGYMATASDVKLANPFQLSKTGTAGTFQDMTTNFADFLTGSAGSDGSGTAYVQQVIGADPPGAYSITLTFTGGFN